MDPEVILYECAFIRDLIFEIKDFDNVVAYEPGNETNCLNLLSVRTIPASVTNVGFRAFDGCGVTVK